MTPAQFRKLALGLPEAVEVGHMGHPDFRVANRVFASLGYPDKQRAMVKLLPDQQARFHEAMPTVFVPVKGSWGRHGATNILLREAKVGDVRSALAKAWENAAPKTLAKRYNAELQ